MSSTCRQALQLRPRGLIYGTTMPDGSCLGIAVTEPHLDTYCGETIINVPYISSTSDGSQEVNPDSGVRTIVIKNLESNVSVIFDGYTI